MPHYPGNDFAFTVSLFSAGLTVTASLVTVDGDVLAEPIAGTVTEQVTVGTQTLYRVTFAAADMAAMEENGTVVVQAAGEVDRAFDIAWDVDVLTPLAAVASDVAGIEAAIGASTIVPTSSAVSTDGGTLYLVRGNSYQTGQGWAPPSWAYTGAVPDLTGAGVYLRLPGAGDIEMDVTAITGGYDLDVDLTAAQTGAINGDYWEIVAKWVTDGAVTGVRRLLAGKVEWQ